MVKEVYGERPSAKTTGDIVRKRMESKEKLAADQKRAADEAAALQAIREQPTPMDVSLCNECVHSATVNIHVNPILFNVDASPNPF